MFHSLYSKLACVILILFALAGTLILAVFFPAVDMYHKEISQKLNRDLAKSIVKENLLVEANKVNEDALKNVFHMMMVINPSIELYLLNPEGKILTYSAAPGKVKLDAVDLTPVHSWLDGKSSIPLLGLDPRNPRIQKIFSAAEILRQDKLEGYLYIILGGEDFDSIAQKLQHSYILRVSGWIIFAGFFLTAVIGLLTFFMLTRRLKTLAKGIEAFQTGRELSSITLPRGLNKNDHGDEIAQLTSTFSEMANRIENQVEQLEKTDQTRRELIANVSHDLRTPLATLTAYIETLQLKSQSFSEQERDQHLATTKKHCSRLTSLVNDLFELSTLEAAETTLTIEPFNLADLVQDIVLNYQLMAKKKNITLSADNKLQNNFVLADIRLIERTLENLLSNGLRHTPVGGLVTVQLFQHNYSARVQVQDSGAGIDEELLPNIFDRYQSGRNRTQSGGYNSGLGLAIAKRIIDLHGSRLNASSSPKSGSCFWFDLSPQD